MPISIEASRDANTACARTLAASSALVPALGHLACAKLRPQGDAAACHHRFALGTDALRHRPDGKAGRLFDQLAQGRAEYLGAQWLPGVRHNLLSRKAAAGLAHLAFIYFMRGADPAHPSALLPDLEALAECLGDETRFAIKARAIGLTWGDKALDSPDQSADSPKNQSQDSQRDSTDGNSTGEEQSAQAEETGPGVPVPPLPEALLGDYRIFSTRHDRVVTPADLATSAELDSLRATLDRELQSHRLLVTRLAHRLQRLLLARKRSQWNLDQDEGWLDPSRLARLVANPSRSEIFRMEEEGPFRHTAVTLLLDNSGSMRGHSMMVTALVADILTHALEKCGIKVELLGFTTADMDGGAPAREWEAAGCPANPGRLCAVRHIIYKSMEAPWRRSRKNLALMLKPDLLKENVDGEALAWAARRLIARPEPRRLLIVISDGAPMDKRTLAANPKNYLEQHLHQVVAWTRDSTDIELHALGIGHPVSRYYPDSVSLRKVNELGTTLMDKLADWLK